MSTNKNRAQTQTCSARIQLIGKLVNNIFVCKRFSSATPNKVAKNCKQIDVFFNKLMIVEMNEAN